MWAKDNVSKKTTDKSNLRFLRNIENLPQEKNPQNFPFAIYFRNKNKNSMKLISRTEKVIHNIKANFVDKH